jgi:hypothetical protein
MHDAGALKKTTFAVHNRMFPRAARVNPPCFAIRTLCRENHALFADSATPEQERRVLARRGVRYGRCAARINALLADDATPKQKRRASTRRALEVALAGAIRHTITGYLACNQERRASARRGSGIAPATATGFRG